MDGSLTMVLDQVSKDKGIDRSVLIRALEESILAAAKRTFGMDRNLLAVFNPEKGAVDLTQTIVVVPEVVDPDNEMSREECERRGIDADIGDEMVFPIYFLDQDAQAAREQDDLYGDILHLRTYRRSFGRIAAQTAKQVIIQRVRDAERNLVYSEYKDRKGELVAGIVRRFERGNGIVDLGRAEAILPVREQCSREVYRPGDRVQAYVLEVQEHARGPQIVLSRTCPELLVKLFELEVPEIYEGIVRIESAAREPGARAKIAVSSSDRDVDPVGACVGMKGSRVQAVVQELRGEKIDIVPWSEDPATFVCNALQPAEVSRVLLDEGNRTMEIIVPDDQLSLAIGRKGQNVRLASHLTGWRLDIHSESRIQAIKERAWSSLTRVAGLNEFTIQTLYNHGIRSAGQLLQADVELLRQFPGMDEESLHNILQQAKQVSGEEREEEAQAQLEAQRAQQASEIGRKLQQLLRMDALARVRKLKGLGDTTFKMLQDASLLDVDSLAGLEIEALAERAGLSMQKAKQVRYAAQQLCKEEQQLHEDARACGIVVENGLVVLPAHLVKPANSTASSKQEPAGPVAAADDEALLASPSVPAEQHVQEEPA